MIRINKFFITLIDRKGRIGLKTLRVVENPRSGARLSKRAYCNKLIMMTEDFKNKFDWRDC